MAASKNEGPLRKWGALAVLSLALAIILIDATLLNVALSALIRDLDTTLQKLQWVISAYSLILAAFTVTGGRLGDVFGRKRMFMTGAVVFVVGAVIASVSHSFPLLLLGESIIEGFGAAIMMPSTASLLVAKYKGHDRAIAFGIWGAVAAAATAIGPILGGFLTTHYSWRWGFRINVVVVALLLAGSPLVDDARPEERKTFDWLGVLLSAAGLFLVVFGIIESESYGRRALLASLAGAVVVGLFALWEWRLEARGGTPVVSMRLFANRHFVAGAGVISVMMIAQTGVIFSLPVFLQSVRHLDALHTGLALLPMSAMIVIVSPATAPLTRHIAHKRLVQIGLVLNGIGILVVRWFIAADMSPARLIPGLLIYGIGLGLVTSQINNMTLSAVTLRSAGEASGVMNTFRQIGITMGTAIIGAILISAILMRLESAIAQGTSVPPASKPQVIGLLRAKSPELAFGERGLFDAFPPPVRGQLTALRNEATTNGLRQAFLWCALASAVALLVSTLLPMRPDERAT